MSRDRESIYAIEDRLHDHERELARTLEAIRDRLTSREMVGELYDRARTSGYTRALGRAVRDNPLPTVLAGICAAWLAKSVGEAVLSERKARRESAEGDSETVEDATLSQVALSDTAAGGKPGEERSAESGSEGGDEQEGGRVVRPPTDRPHA